MPRGGAVTLADVSAPTLSIVCERCGRYGRYANSLSRFRSTLYAGFSHLALCLFARPRRKS
jgi:hypothetical protein